MKQVKILFEKCKKKMPHRPPDEIDFRLGFRAAAGWIFEMKIYSAHCKTQLDVLKDRIKEELK